MARWAARRRIGPRPLGLSAGLTLIVGAATASVLRQPALPAAAPAARGASTDSVPACPATARTAPAGVALQPLLDALPAGAVLCLLPGDHDGPLVIHSPLTLLGPGSAVIRSDGQGTTVRVLASHAVLRGFTVDGSGKRYDKMDAAVYVRGDSVEVRGLTIQHALFGLVAEQSRGVTFAENHVVGDPDLAVGIRGDGIRFWEVRGSAVLGNRLEDSRDIVIWYSPGNRIAGNTVVRSRYATHFMYSSDCVVEDNHYSGNIVGVFIMYSRDIVLRGNVITDNTVADGMGLGVKESGNITVERNRFVRDNQCVYLDTSPFREGDSMLVRLNTFALCNAAVTFHSSETHNTFAANAFQGNQSQVVVEGRGNARGVSWAGNYFDDYRGYDLDGDGFGDVAYELRSLSERLVSEHPALAFFRGTMALALVDVAAQVLPVLQPETLMADPHPRMTRPAGAG